MALRWKKHPRPTGLARVVAGPPGSTLRDGDVEYVTVYAKRVDFQTTGWYFVTNPSVIEYENTCNNVVPDEATAKTMAMAYVRSKLKLKKEEQ